MEQTEQKMSTDKVGMEMNPSFPQPHKRERKRSTGDRWKIVALLFIGIQASIPMMYVGCHTPSAVQSDGHD